MAHTSSVCSCCQLNTRQMPDPNQSLFIYSNTPNVKFRRKKVTLLWPHLTKCSYTIHVQHSPPESNLSTKQAPYRPHRNNTSRKHTEVHASLACFLATRSMYSPQICFQSSVHENTASSVFMSYRNFETRSPLNVRTFNWSILVETLGSTKGASAPFKFKTVSNRVCK